MKKSLIILSLVALGLSACSSGPGTGYFSLSLTDMPADAKELNITIDEIYLYPPDGVEDQEPVLIYKNEAPDPEINLLEYTNGKTKDLIVNKTVPADDYGQIRIILADGATLVLEGVTDATEDDVSEDVKIPSRDLKVPYPISVEEGTYTKVTLDFDAEKSLHMAETGSDKYILRPVIHVVNVTFGTS